MVHNRLKLDKVDLVITTKNISLKEYSEQSKKWNMNFSISSSQPNMQDKIPDLNSDQNILPSRFSSNKLKRRSTIKTRIDEHTS